ncbi:unnamed protein product, partial [Prunus brigantina]
GGKFLNHNLHKFLQDHGIIHQRSCPYTPQQNGVDECNNQHLLELVCAFVFDANMPRSFWGVAILSATYLINLMPSNSLETRILAQNDRSSTRLIDSDRLPFSCYMSPLVFIEVLRLWMKPTGSPIPSDQSSTCCQNQEKEVDPCSKILLALDPYPFSSIVPVTTQLH